MDQERLADHVANNPVDHLNGMIRRAELQDPRRGAAGPGELQVFVPQPDDEDLGLDRTLDIPAGGRSCHGCDRTPGQTAVASFVRRNGAGESEKGGEHD